MPVELITGRLVLRRWRAADAEPFAALNADPEVMRYFPATLDRPASDALIDRAERSFAEHGYGLWALERRSDGQFLGFTGLAWQTFPAAFTPALEVGWRLVRDAWGQGYATEAAEVALNVGFAAGLPEIVSMTTVTNRRSQAVMQRLGMTRNPADDFDHPNLPIGHALRPHVLYRLASTASDSAGQAFAAHSSKSRSASATRPS